MDRYKDIEPEENRLSRVAKNDSLYDEIKSSKLSRVKADDNVKVLESSGKTINIDKIRKYLEEENKEPLTTKRAKLEVENKETSSDIKLDETKEYDLSAVLEKAKRNREIDYQNERYKKLKNDEYDILNKLKEYELEYTSEEDDEERDLNTGERTLVDLINTVAKPGEEVDLLSSLTQGETGEITLPIDEEKTKGTLKEEILSSTPKKGMFDEITITKVDTTALKEAKKEEEKEEELNKTKELSNLKQKTSEYDKSFFTSSMTFSKADFEGFEELEKSVKKNSALSKIVLGFIVLFVVVSLVLIINYVFKLGLF